MLILSRNIGEAILIGDDISVTVSNVQGGQVRLAIDAPKSVAVDRAELRQRKIDNPRHESGEPQHIDERIRAAASEPVTLCVHFELPNAQAASALVNILPHGQFVFGTQAKVRSMTALPATEADPRDLFVAANPVGATPDELEKGRNGFVDERTHADYLIFLAGYRAAQEAEPCAD